MQNINQSETRRYNRLLSEIDTVYHEIALHYGFSDSASAILYALTDNDGKCRLTDLIKLICINKQTVNSALRRLEEENIVYLEPCGGKSKQVCLTEKGFDITKNTFGKVIDIEKKIYSSWSKEEWELYVKLTERYLSRLKEEIKEIL